jgi:hypothetical protein
MTKRDLLKEMLARVGDPEANSETFSSLAWSLFIETLYAAIPDLGIAEGKAYLTMLYEAITTDENGVGKIVPNWDNIAGLVGVSLESQGYSVPLRTISEEELVAIMGNPFYVPSGAPSEGGYCLYNKTVYIVSGIASGVVNTGLAVYADIKTAFDALTMDDRLPIHNAMAYAVLPEATNKLKQEVGLAI